MLSCLRCKNFSGVPFAGFDTGVPQPDKIKTLTNVRLLEPRSAQIARPEGVTRAFQVSRYKIEPTEAVLARNLLSKDDCRVALLNEFEPCRPKVAFIRSSFPLSCG